MKYIPVRLEQPANAFPAMLVTLAGIVRLVYLVKSSNAFDPMLVTGRPLRVAGRTTAIVLHRLEQPVMVRLPALVE